MSQSLTGPSAAHSWSLDARQTPSRSLWNPPFASARSGDVFRPAVVDGSLEIPAEQRRYPAFAADAAAAALLEFGIGGGQYGRLGHEVEESEADGAGGREHRRIDS